VVRVSRFALAPRIKSGAGSQRGPHDALASWGSPDDGRPSKHAPSAPNQGGSRFCGAPLRDAPSRACAMGALALRRARQPSPVARMEQPRSAGAGRDQRRVRNPQPVAAHRAEAAAKLTALAAFSIHDMLSHSSCSSTHVPQGAPAGARAGGVRKKRKTATPNPMTPKPRMTPAPISNPSANKATQAAPPIAASTRAKATTHNHNPKKGKSRHVAPH
jgi:hypothetical protein